jgi:epoxyqueuosine reductase
MPNSISDHLQRLQAQARAEGLVLMRVTAATLPDLTGQRLTRFLEAGHHGEMAWMAETARRRAAPDVLWPHAKSAILFAMPYTPEVDPMQRLDNKTSGVISVYALNRDYHEVFKGKLKRLAQNFAKASGAEVKVFVDTAPLMEKPLAAQAGLGWQGKHTNLVSRQAGSWFFIGSILTALDLPPDQPEQDHCGSCRNCLEVCPTAAFPAPYQLDARRCISYLTIEHKGTIAAEFREAIGNRIYGCDDCLAVCPWNKFAVAASEMKLKARPDLLAPALAELLQLDDAGFRKHFSASPVKRIGRDRFVRNCLIAAGNSGEAGLVPVIEKLLDDAAALVRAMAVWALWQLAPAAVPDLRQRHAALETDMGVQAEWRAQ